jgi:glycine hydroxymethyltransferase
MTMVELQPLEEPHRTLARLLARVEQDEAGCCHSISLAAYENRLSNVAARFMDSPLAGRYSLGTLADHGLREVVVKDGLMFKGLPGVSELEGAAHDAACRMFAAAGAEFRPLSGVHAMLCTLAAATAPGDLVYSIDPGQGGHFATRHIATRLGRQSRYLPWDAAHFAIDVDRLAGEARQHRPAAVFLDHGATLFPLNLRELRAALGREPLMVVDASHTLGLVAGGRFQAPLLEGADILQGNTHKSFPGPHKAMILCRERGLSDRLSRAITGGLVSSQHTQHAVAQYITCLEMQSFGAEYADRMLDNARVLASALQAAGIELVERDGVATESHVLLIKGCGGWDLYEACQRLMECDLRSNARTAYGMVVLRLGTQEVTRRGMGPQEMRAIAGLFEGALFRHEPVARIRAEVGALSRRFPNVHHSFDRELGYWQ